MSKMTEIYCYDFYNKALFSIVFTEHITFCMTNVFVSNVFVNEVAFGESLGL